MIRFVDLKTGNIFDGTPPYIFWVEGEQSVNISYSQPICFISDNSEVQVSVENNNIFKLVNPNLIVNNDLVDLYGFEYYDIEQLIVDGELLIKGVLHHNYYIYLMYIVCEAEQSGQYECSFFINEFKENAKVSENVYTIGADFYDENESLSINLINKGVEISPAIQKAIYDINVHEEHIDYITINRKWKELLSNYWDVIANKGSYKSLQNSLKWFEYGDLIQLYELWEHSDNKYESRNIQSVLKNKYYEMLNGFSKTTYLSLRYALEKIKFNEGKLVYDDEKNPDLKYVVDKWSVKDLALKLCMLGHFYKKYFMPIHLDLIHSTIEDIVYTNTIKIINSPASDRCDYVYDNKDIQCNVKNGDVFNLSVVKCYTDPDTLFGSKNINESIIVGVQRQIPDIKEGDLPIYTSQLYNDIGTIVDFELYIPDDDIIKKEILSFRSYSNGNSVWRTNVDYKILKNNINFSLLCPHEGEYVIKLQLEGLSGNVYTKLIKFSVIDTNNPVISIYKVQNIGECIKNDGWNRLMKPHHINEYMFNRVKNNKQTCADVDNILYKQYIVSSSDSYNGVKFNHLLIISDLEKVPVYIRENYFILTREVDRDIIDLNNGEWYERFELSKKLNKKVYTICISKEFNFKYDKSKIEGLNIYRNDYIFVPEFHELITFGQKPVNKKEDLSYYTITDSDTLCIIPDIVYGKCIKQFEWEFINNSSLTAQKIELPKSIKDPFIINNKKRPLDPGYYSIKFRYRLSNDESNIHEIVINNAFLKK